MDVLVAYGACKKNQNHTSTTPILDGCMEFSSNYKGERKCEACGCHRSFHERIILMRDQNGNISCASQMMHPDSSPGALHRSPNAPPALTNSPTLSNVNTTTTTTTNFNNKQVLELGSYQPLKRRKMDELPGEDSYSEFINARSGRSSPTTGAIIPTQPVPLQAIEVYDDGSAATSTFKGHHHAQQLQHQQHQQQFGGSSGWLCEADKEKLFGYKKEVVHHHQHHNNTHQGGGLGGLAPAPPEKLASFFERLQKEHPESPLKLEYVDDSWRVLCGVCARYLRADKKGETLHNIQKQHFVTPKHISNLKAKMEAPDEMEFWLKRMAKLREKRAQQQRAQTRYITAG